ncbi:MAG: hypothetical protein RLQ12_01075, partial [Cyclobacteriaceae bacterium]
MNSTKEPFSISHQYILRSLLLIVLVLSQRLSMSQQSMTMDSCIVMAEKNYPLIRQYDLLEKSSEYSVENVGKGKLPRFNVIGQATYQSDVTSLPGGLGPEISKDQYKLYGQIVQPLTDLATVEKQKQ